MGHFRGGNDDFGDLAAVRAVGAEVEGARLAGAGAVAGCGGG